MGNSDTMPRSALVDLYKIAADSAERVSDRRQSANAYFLTFVTALIAAYFASYSDSEIPQQARYTTGVVGVLVCGGWIAAIWGFRKHNEIKFRIICELEKQLPIAFYSLEDRYFQMQRIKLRFTTVELIFPAVSILFFLATLFLPILA